MSQLEKITAILLKSNGIKFIEQVDVIPGRKFRFDFQIIGTNILIEIQGGQWITGRHNHGSAMTKQYEKYNLAQIHGYRVLQYGTDMIRNNPMQIIEDIRGMG